MTKHDTCKTCGSEVDEHGLGTGVSPEEEAPKEEEAPTEEAKKALFLKAATQKGSEA